MNELIDTKEQSFEDRLKAIRQDGLDILRQAGFVLSFQGDNPLIEIICENIKLCYNDDRVEFLVDGMDMTDVLTALNVVIRPGKFPAFNVTLWPKAINTVNISDEKLGIKLVPR